MKKGILFKKNSKMYYDRPAFLQKCVKKLDKLSKTVYK